MKSDKPRVERPFSPSVTCLTVFQQCELLTIPKNCLSTGSAPALVWRFLRFYPIVAHPNLCLRSIFFIERRPNYLFTMSGTFAGRATKSGLAAESHNKVSLVPSLENLLLCYLILLVKRRATGYFLVTQTRNSARRLQPGTQCRYRLFRQLKDYNNGFSAKDWFSADVVVVECPSSALTRKSPEADNICRWISRDLASPFEFILFIYDFWPFLGELRQSMNNPRLAPNTKLKVWRDGQ